MSAVPGRRPEPPTVADIPLPWEQLVITAPAAERKLLLEMRRLYDAGPLDEAAKRRMAELHALLASLGTWQRLDALAAEYQATVNALIIAAPTEEEHGGPQA